jgi:hypothetical protein
MDLAYLALTGSDALTVILTKSSRTQYPNLKSSILADHLDR